MNGWKKHLLIFAVLCSCVGCDRVTKDVARETLEFAPAMSLFNGRLHLLYAENPGVAFSLGADWPEPVRRVLLIVGVGSLLIGMGAFFFRQRHAPRLLVIGASLIVGGGFGNLLDRILNDGRVIDFMMIRVGVLQTAIFNLADVLILAGFALLVYSMLRSQPAPGESPVPSV